MKYVEIENDDEKLLLGNGEGKVGNAVNFIRGKEIKWEILEKRSCEAN